MSTVAGVIQARMGSSRLPGKSLARVYKNFSLLELVMLRVMKTEKMDMVILATSKERDCDPLVELADSLGILTVRGSGMDVLSRFIEAIQQYNPDIVVRICADNPLIDPVEIDKLISFFQENQFDYAANNTPACGLPDGIGCEIIRSSTITKIATKALDNGYREHVTSYITSHPDEYSIGWLEANQKLWCPDLKLDIDTQEDLARIQEFCYSLAEVNAPYWTAEEIILNAQEINDKGCSFYENSRD